MVVSGILDLCFSTSLPPTPLPHRTERSQARGSIDVSDGLNGAVNVGHQKPKRYQTHPTRPAYPKERLVLRQSMNNLGGETVDRQQLEQHWRDRWDH